jgi:hypothetical protein
VDQLLSQIKRLKAESLFTSSDDHCPVSWVSILCDAVPQTIPAFIGLAALLADLALLAQARKNS